MPATYAVNVENATAQTSAHTLVWIYPATNYPIVMLRAYWGQTGTATSAQQRVKLYTQTTTFPSSLTAATPIKLIASDATSNIIGATTGFIGTSGVSAVTEGGGTATVLYADAVNNLNGFLWVPSPNEVIRVNAAQTAGFGLKLGAAPSSVTGHNAGVHFME